MLSLPIVMNGRYVLECSKLEPHIRIWGIKHSNINGSVLIDETHS
jgi:hypothetical protein